MSMQAVDPSLMVQARLVATTKELGEILMAMAAG
jgi:hypothetical protein